MTTDPMRDELIRLAPRMERIDIPLIVGGGYGLWLKDDHVRRHRIRTLREVPQSRTTKDIDLFLSAEVIVDPARTQALRYVLDELEYKPNPGRENYQFVRTQEVAGFDHPLVIDLIASEPVAGRERVVTKDRRIRPRGFRDLHARRNPAAVTVTKHLCPVPLVSTADEPIAYVPNVFSTLLLKLFAVRDRLEDESTRYGRHHAFDMYRAIALATEEEFSHALELRDEFRQIPPVPEARAIIRELFADSRSPGALRLREHARDHDFELTEDAVEAFIRDLRELMIE